ncbi:MAG TPA: hypothetical protein VFM93_12750 [Candidatus Limnocylindria bacterium]|nr:hypothetical protein [Candidatus Limnocylindria bacterium]
MRLDLSELAPHRFQELWPAGSEFALYSPRGAWGVMLGEDGLLVAAGGDAFTRTLLAAQKVDPRQQVRDFIAMWRDDRKRLWSDISWLRPLLANIYPAEADALLAESSEP